MARPDCYRHLGDELASHVAEGERAQKLLEKIWHEVGPYHSENVSSKTWNEVREFFKFDDSP